MIIGIDLGTTNCACAWTEVPAASSECQLNNFAINQLTYPGTVEPRNTLPSFLYLPGPHEMPTGSTALPWDPQAQNVVGWLAREQSPKLPHRVISSAKSWLSCDTIDRHAPLLPWGAPEETEHLSPVEASSLYLEHIASAWDFENPNLPFREQDLVITVPASFDAAARDLTVAAARQAGLEKFTLLEEPQAAFYAWLAQSENDWRSQVEVGEQILVCDIGGGTTDFSLIAVTGEAGNLGLERLAVGRHLLLGGDNMDLTLATAVQQRLKKEQGLKLDSWQMQVLTHGCRVGKEQLLQEYADDEWPITIPGRGSSLIGGALRTELKRSEVETILLEGFFPRCAINEAAQLRPRAGLREMGLPYEMNPAITKHLAAFLSLQHALTPGNQSFFRPTAVLFNGGVLKAPAVQARLLEVINGWIEAEGVGPIKVLQGRDHDLAVARGAARYGLARLGQGIRIKGGTNRSYYIGVETAMPAIPGLEVPIKALCVAPFGMEEGSQAEIAERVFGLVTGEPAEFRFLSSTSRPQDQVGDLIDDWEEDIEEINGLSVTLKKSDVPGGSLTPVRLESHVTEIGTLELWCRETQGDERWKLEFDVRSHE